MAQKSGHDWFELWLDRYPDLPSVVLIRSLELKHFPKELVGDSVLDLCCGDGFFTQCLGLKGIDGCDIDPAAVEQAARRKETYARAEVCDARDLNIYDSGHFSTVFSNCALEHVDGVDQALVSVARILKTGGRLIMSIPDRNLNAWFFPVVFFRMIGFPGYGRRLCREYNRKQGHFNIHSVDIWENKLAGAGLAIEEKFYLFNEEEYKIVTFFESFALDSFPGPFLRRVHSLLKKTMPVEMRKSLWRKFLKKTFINSERRDSGGELVIVACKR